jgi:hypothetical protein
LLRSAQRPPRRLVVGSTTPRLWTKPLVFGSPGPCGCGCALTPETSLGFSAVRFAEEVLDIRLIPWQRWLLIHALELRRDGGFRFRTILILVARQNGKTTLIEVKNLWKLFDLRVPLIIGTAQNLDISEESWDKGVEIAESIPELAAEVEHVDRTNGKKALRLSHGSRWKIAAASRKGGRGLSGDDVNLDELREHQTWESWAAVTKTTMAKPNAQVFAFSNAGDDKSIVLNDLLDKARAATKALDWLIEDLTPVAADLALVANQAVDTTLGLFEWSAPEHIKCSCGRPNNVHTTDCLLQDRDAWAAANPSLGYTVTEEALASALATDPDAVFRTECLCQHVPSLAEEWQVIPEALWRSLVAEKVRPVDIALAVQVDYARKMTAIVAVGRRLGNPDHLVTSIVDYRPGTDWVVDRVLDLKNLYHPIAIAMQDKGPTGSLEEDFARVGLRPPVDPDRPQRGDLAVPWASDVADAYGMWVDAVSQRRLWHLDEEPMNAALATAETRPLGGATAFAYQTAAPLVGSKLALWAYETRVEKVVQRYDPLANIG